MAVTPTYGEIALYCPAWVEPAAPLSPSASPAPPLTYNTFTQGQSSGTSLMLNQDNRRNEIIAQHGGAGAHGVFYGLNLSVSSGLTLAYSAGGANVNGPQVKSVSTLALTGSVYNWVWITSAGTVTKVTGTNRLSVPAAPTSACAFLGRVLCDSASIIEIDYSGRHTLRGGTCYRRTADDGEPTDTPSATTLFMTRTTDGVWFWDGASYQSVGGDLETLQEENDALTERVDQLEYLLRAKLRSDFYTFGEAMVPADPILAAEFALALGGA